MDKIFCQQIRKIVQCYVDDNAVKSRVKSNHLANIKEVFDLMRKHKLKMKFTKSFLGVFSKKILGFVIDSKGIYLDPEKVRAIQELQPTRNLKELRGQQGRLAYIRRFIANHSG